MDVSNVGDMWADVHWGMMRGRTFLGRMIDVRILMFVGDARSGFARADVSRADFPKGGRYMGGCSRGYGERAFVSGLGFRWADVQCFGWCALVGCVGGCFESGRYMGGFPEVGGN